MCIWSNFYSKCRHVQRPTFSQKHNNNEYLKKSDAATNTNMICGPPSLTCGDASCVTQRVTTSHKLCRPISSKSTHFRSSIVFGKPCSVYWGHRHLGLTWIDTISAKISAKNKFHISALGHLDHWLCDLKFALPVTPYARNLPESLNVVRCSVVELTVGTRQTDGLTDERMGCNA